MLNVATLKAARSKAPIENRRGGKDSRDLGPNFFLDPKWEFNLKNSYDKKEPYKIVVAGTYVDSEYLRGKKKGEKMSRLTGDAADAVTLIRKAATKLGIGAAIREYTGKGPDGEVIPKGHVLIQYLGQKPREVKPKSTPVVVPAVTPETTEGVAPAPVSAATE
jgi:hypothetical protein